MDTDNPSRDLPKLMIRMPRDMKLWLMAQAKRNASSQNSEIIRTLRERMDRETVTKTRTAG